MNLFDNFDRFIHDAMQSWHCPGLALSVICGDDILYRKAFGFRDVENRVPMTEDTRFAMASVTKSFTAMSVAVLVDDGVLDWDTPVREYMPEFILKDPYVTEHVTIRDMLSHRTGLPRHDYSAWRLDIPLADYIKRMKHFTFTASFRGKFQYNNLMYYATAYLVEKVTGTPWKRFVMERILAPLAMYDSNLEPEPSRNGPANAKGYRLDRDDSGNPVGLVCMPLGNYTALCPGAAGGLFSTLDDLTRWLAVHVSNGRNGNEPFVSQHNLKQMHLPHMVVPTGGITETMMGSSISTYGLGWFIEPYRGKTLVHHGGNLEGFSLEIGFVPQDRIGVIVLTNLAMLPLRDVLLFESIDRATGTKDRDWNETFHVTFDPLIAAGSKARVTSREERIEQSPPTHSMDSFAGVYDAVGYPDFEVTYEGGALHARLANSLDWSDVRHYHYNVFEWHMADFDEWVKIRFPVSDTGTIDSVSIPIEPEVENVDFYRKPVTLPETVLSALPGRFDPGIEGLQFTLAVQDGKVYITSSDGNREQIFPFRMMDSRVEFKQDRTRYECIREKGAFSLLVIKNPGMTLEARRVE